MEKELVFIQCCPIDLYFHWQTEVQLTNFKQYGYDKLAHVLVFISHDKIHKGIPSMWRELESKFPDTKFFYYFDHKNITGTAIRMFEYIPLLRPYCLNLHFQAYPELKDKAIFYHDADIIFTKFLDFTPFLNDDVCYLSLCARRDDPNDVGYISSRYFDSKIKDVKPEALELYKTIDVLNICTDMFGINREVAVRNEKGSGGAQYILKNVDHTFWNNVYNGCVTLRLVLQNINEKFFAGSSRQERENKGFQRWCADMWAILYSLWARDQVTVCPPELDFAWATNEINKLDSTYIMHNAGATPDSGHLFFKSAKNLVNNIETPYNYDFWWVSPDYCSIEYVKAIQKVIKTKTK